LFFVWFLGTIAAVIALIFVSIHLNTVQKDLMSNNNAVQGNYEYISEFNWCWKIIQKNLLTYPKIALFTANK
jgi:hypothetical protein